MFNIDLLFLDVFYWAWACGWSSLGVGLAYLVGLVVVWWCVGLVCVLRGFGLRMSFKTEVQQANPKPKKQTKSNKNVNS